MYNSFSHPPRNIIDQALAHCSHSLLQPPKESRSYCIPTQLYILSTSQRSSACKLLPYQLPNLTKLLYQHTIFWYQGFTLTINVLPLCLLLVRHVKTHVRLHVSSKLLAFSRARIKLIIILINLKNEKIYFTKFGNFFYIELFYLLFISFKIHKNCIKWKII